MLLYKDEESSLQYVNDIDMYALREGMYLINKKTKELHKIIDTFDQYDSDKVSDTERNSRERAYLSFFGFTVLQRSLGNLFEMSAYGPRRVKTISEENLKYVSC